MQESTGYLYLFVFIRPNQINALSMSLKDWDQDSS